MENQILLPAQLDTVKKVIQTELLKRGYLAKIIDHREVQNARGDHFISLKTESFQTVPVMFQTLTIEAFNSRVEIGEGVRANGDPFVESRVWVTIHVDYELFGGGRNGVKLFDVRMSFFEDTISYDLKIN